MSIPFEFDPGLPIRLQNSGLLLEFGPGVFSPAPEMRTLDAIRPSLRNPKCDGPDPVYGIYMDIGYEADRALLQERMLLFGAVIYATGTLGSEPVRSQGHIHAVSPHCGWSTPEIFEIWNGKAIVYGQQSADDHPGRCVAVVAKAGDKVVMPPGWAHCVINADPVRHMSFGALCDRQYGFEYAGVRKHHGLAWFPTLNSAGQIEWEPNSNYLPSELELHEARTYPELRLDASATLYEQFAENPDSMMFVSEPQRAANCWPSFLP